MKKEKMKTKKKVVALLEIAVVLCSVFLVALPAIAADTQKASASAITTASEDDYVLGIYGNANEDDTIDMGDVVYTKLAIFGKKPKTELCDAKYDGRINVLDVIQTKLIILGKEKEITVVDVDGDVETIRKPVERIVIEYMDNAELIRILDAKDKVVGVDYVITKSKTQFPELSKRSLVGKKDYESILNLNPDLLLPFMGGSGKEVKKEKLPGVAVVFLGMYYPDLSNPEGSKFTDGVRKLGYILDREDEAEEYINWRIGWIDEIKSRTEGISEDERPRVLVCGRPKPGLKTFSARAKIGTLAQMCLLARGKSIVEDLPEFVQPAGSIKIDAEWVIEQNPEFILAHVVHHTWGWSTKSPSHGYDEDDPTGVKEELRDMIMNSPVLANVDAVKTGKVYIMSGNFRNDASGGLVGAAYMAKLLHPELFEDLDPEAIHQEYLELQHFDYDLDEHGVFFYLPIITGEGKLAGIPDRYYDSIVAQP
jgi:iron complex transport system substrate-binding protein